jgi:hypothetical protein
MKTRYSRHLENRLRLRRIDYGLPEKIVQESKERYYDVDTGHFIAMMKVELYGRPREVMVAYVAEGDVSKLLTIHPLKEGQKENRVATGRWRKL